MANFQQQNDGTDQASGDFNGGYQQGPMNDSEIAGVMGTANAIPFLNTITPGMTAALEAERDSNINGRIIANAEGLKGPQFDKRGYQTQNYAGDFKPDMYSTPEAAQYQTISEDPRVRGMQMEAIQNMQGYANGAANSQQALDRQQALNDSQILAKQQMGAIQNQAARRGQLGSGLDYVLQNQAGQQGANRAQTGYMNAAAQAAMQRLQGMQGTMQGASQMRGQDFNTNNANAGIINAFNMHNADARNAASQSNVNMRNSAGLRNQNTLQNLNGSNTGIMNAGIDRNDANAMHTFDTNNVRMGNINNALKGQVALNPGAMADAAGKTGFNNLKSSMGMAAGGVGGGGDAGGGGGMDMASMMKMFGGGK